MTTPLGKPRLISGDPTHLLERFSVADQTALDPRAPILQNYISLHLLRFDIRYSIFNVRCSMSVSRQSRHSRVVRVEFCGGQLYDPHIQTMEYMREVIPVNPVTLLAPRVSGVSTSTFNFVSMIEEYTQYSSHMADQPHRASRESLAIYPCPAADSESPYNVL
jgi:hypothetical protein